jgi:hypothetical protein
MKDHYIFIVFIQSLFANKEAGIVVNISGSLLGILWPTAEQNQLLNASEMLHKLKCLGLTVRRQFL